MRRRKKKIVTIAAILILGALVGSGLADEMSARIAMALRLTRTLDYYEYHWRGDKESRLLSMSLYSWKKQGTQRVCREYVPISAVEAALVSYTLEGYDDKGSCVYQKQLTTDGVRDTYWTCVYDGQGRIGEKGIWTADRGGGVEKDFFQIQKYRYYESGISVSAVYDYRGNNPTGILSGMAFCDGDGHEFLHKTYGDGEGAQDTDQITLQIGAYGREELVFKGDRLIAYRWFDHDSEGNISFLLEIMSEGTEPVRYLCTYTIYGRDLKGRLELARRYEPVKEKYPGYYVHYRVGDTNTGIYLDFDENGWLYELASVYFRDEDQPGEVLYRILFQEDGTFELAAG